MHLNHSSLKQLCTRQPPAMDLLGNYGSDADSDASDDERQAPQNAGRAVLTAPSPSADKLKVGGPSLPPTGVTRAGLFAALPPPKGRADGLHEGEPRKEGGRLDCNNLLLYAGEVPLIRL